MAPASSRRSPVSYVTTPRVVFNMSRAVFTLVAGLAQWRAVEVMSACFVTTRVHEHDLVVSEVIGLCETNAAVQEHRSHSIT